MKCSKCLKHLGILMATLAMSVVLGFAQNKLPIQTDAPLRLTVTPNVSSSIVMETLPQATCVLHAEGASDEEHRLKLFADDQGMVRFNVRPSAESDKKARFEVDCAANGKVATFPLHLLASFSPTADMPSPVPETRKLQPGASVRAALTEDEAFNLGSDELAKRGYPLRPDENQTPGAFDAWLKTVTRPSRFVAPRLVARPEVRHSPRITNGTENSNNWSGFELNGGGNVYDWVMGEWQVPTVSPESNQHIYSALWIGLDGDGTTDLVQAGTEQEITDISFWGFIHFDFTSFYGWTEFLPQQPFEQVIPNFTVAPGDQILAQVYVGDPGSPGASLSGGYGIFWVENVTRAEHTTIYTSRCAASFWGVCFNWTNVGGSEAEWIMERPTLTVNGQQSLPDLANYGVAFMDKAAAHIANSGPFFMGAQGGAPFLQISMFNGNDLLSDVSKVTFDEMKFVWHNFH
jgi:hypothetical protein